MASRNSLAKDESKVLGHDELVLGLYKDTYEHIHSVQEKMLTLVSALNCRLLQHDLSKLSEPEASKYSEVIPKLQKTRYNTKKYHSLVKKLGPALEHHHQNNPHHPEHYENGINGMTLVDLLEMFCDWYAASQRETNGMGFTESLAVNSEKYEMSDQLVQIFANTYEKFPELITIQYGSQNSVERIFEEDEE